MSGCESILVAAIKCFEECWWFHLKGDRRVNFMIKDSNWCDFCMFSQFANTQAIILSINLRKLTTIGLPKTNHLWQINLGKLFSLTFSSKFSLREKCPYSEVFWSAFSPDEGESGPERLRIRTLFTRCMLVKSNIGFWKTQMKI